MSHPKDWNFRSVFHQLGFYASNTIDQLSAYSSFIQRVVDDPMPGKKPEVNMKKIIFFGDTNVSLFQVVSQNLKFWELVAGPILTKQLGKREFLYGDEFSALDVIVGIQMIVFSRLDLAF